MSCRVGDIVYISGLPIYPAKGKYAVCVKTAPNRFLLINSENRAIYDCIALQKKANRPFPKHDSFIGCKNIFEATDDQISSIHGCADDSELKAILVKIKNSPYIPKVQKNPVVEALENEIKRRRRLGTPL